MKRKDDENKNGKSYNGKLLLYTNNHIILINCSLKFLRFVAISTSFASTWNSLHLHSSISSSRRFFSYILLLCLAVLCLLLHSRLRSTCFLVTHSTGKIFVKWLTAFFFLFFCSPYPQLSSSLRIPFTIVITRKYVLLVYNSVWLVRRRIKSSFKREREKYKKW